MLRFALAKLGDFGRSDLYSVKVRRIVDVYFTKQQRRFFELRISVVRIIYSNARILNLFYLWLIHNRSIGIILFSKYFVGYSFSEHFNVFFRFLRKLKSNRPKCRLVRANNSFIGIIYALTLLLNTPG